jgi:hypothetical protein
MLESSSLLIFPWKNDPARGGWIRPIAEGETGAALGLVSLDAPASRSWFNWLLPRHLEVLEGDDNALLMTLIRRWGLSRSWELHDAEEQRVGTVYSRVLVESEGGRRGFLDRTDPHHGRIVGPESQTLAEYEAKPGPAVLLRFAADLEANPFLRMLILAGVLVQERMPH